MLLNHGPGLTRDGQMGERVDSDSGGVSVTLIVIRALIVNSLVGLRKQNPRPLVLPRRGLGDDDFVLAGDHGAVPGHGERGQEVVPGDHNAPDLRLLQLSDHRLRLGLEGVLHNEEPEKLQVTLHLGPLHLLDRHPVYLSVQLLHGNRDHTKPVHGELLELLMIVGRNGLGDTELLQLLRSPLGVDCEVLAAELPHNH